MKKIVFTVTNDLTYDQRMNRICNSLVRAGYQVTLVGFLKKRSIKTETQPFEQVRLRVFFKKGKLFYLEYNFRLFWWLLFRNFDIYGGVDLDTLAPVFFNAKVKGRPVVYDAHEYFTELPEIVDRPLIKQFWVRMERFFLPRIQYNYTVGYSIAETLSNKYRQPYAVIRNVPLPETEPGESVKENYILYQGALNTGRGLENLMLAMKNIDSLLYIAGEGDLSNELRTFAASLEYRDKIRFLGYIRPTELKKITRSARIGVNLVENKGLSYYYSLSNKFFDYIQAGIPQVTMNFPEYQRLNDQYSVAVLIDRPGVDEITGALKKLLTEQDVYSELQKNTFVAKQELNWEKEEIRLIEFYQQIHV